MNLTATGSSTSAGTGTPTEVTPPFLTAIGSSMSFGSAGVATGLLPGAVTDFGVWPAAFPDPAACCVEAVSAPDSTGRAFLAATVPTQYTTALGTLWNAAAYAAATGTFQHVSGNIPALTDIQLEQGPDTNLLPPDAADYRDELVYEQATVFIGGGANAWDATVTRVQGYALSGQWCGQLVNNGALSPYSMHPLVTACAAVVPGAEYIGTVNISLERAGASWTGQLMWYDASFKLISTTVSAAQAHPGSMAYQQIRVRDQAPAVANGATADAAWVAVVPAITPVAVGDGEVCYVDCHRVWSLQPSATATPSPFEPARQQVITVRANRVNYVTNPSLTNDVVGWWTSGGGTGTEIAWDGTEGRSEPGALKCSAVYTAGSNAPLCGTLLQAAGQAAPGMIAGFSGRTYTFSAYVKLQADSPPIQMNAVFGGGGPGAKTLGTMDTTETEPDGDGYYRLWVTATIPPSLNGSMMMSFGVAGSAWSAHAADVTWWVDDAMAEESPLLGTYFDASLPSPDYVWEGTAFRSRSHYYQNFRFLRYRLNDLLSDALPVGVSYQLLFAQPDS